MTAIPFHDRLTCTISGAVEATGIGRTKLYELIKRGRVATAMVGRRRLVAVPSLIALLHPSAPGAVGGCPSGSWPRGDRAAPVATPD
jgi:excisionase family DNA binding protein